MASEYDRLTGTDRFAIYADRWLANILGANAWGLSLIVGDGSNFPNCLQHQVANLVGSMNGSAPVLSGAAVEGPNSAGDSGSVDGMKPCPADGVDGYAMFSGQGAEFIDNMESYPNTEPAIDLAATSPLAFAWLES
jgi:endoglucanase